MYVIQWVGLEGEFNMLSILTDYAGELNDLLIDWEIEVPLWKNMKEVRHGSFGSLT